jgi:hypothetical protein
MKVFFMGSLPLLHSSGKKTLNFKAKPISISKEVIFSEGAELHQQDHSCCAQASLLPKGTKES